MHAAKLHIKVKVQALLPVLPTNSKVFAKMLWGICARSAAMSMSTFCLISQVVLYRSFTYTSVAQVSDSVTRQIGLVPPHATVISPPNSREKCCKTDRSFTSWGTSSACTEPFAAISSFFIAGLRKTQNVPSVALSISEERNSRTTKNRKTTERGQPPPKHDENQKTTKTPYV